jgi:23S rRNA (guanosine2251-2'-O)-methyltransferase
MADPKIEILYGFHPVREALRANRRAIHALLIRKERQDDRLKSLREMAAERRIPVQVVDERRLTEMAERGVHQGICAQVGPMPYNDLADVVETANCLTGSSFVLLLDSLQDPRNLGAVLRSAYCAGVDGVVIPRDRSASPSPLVSKASAGAMEHLPIARVPNIVNALRHLKKKGLWVVGLEGGAERSLFDCDLTLPLGLIVGGEEKGLRPLVKQHCDFLVAIPHARVFNSLNASVAAGLAMFETYRQRSPRRSTA